MWHEFKDTMKWSFKEGLREEGVGLHNAVTDDEHDLDRDQ